LDDQKLDGRQTHCLEGVQFLVHLHRAQFGSEGGARTAREHDRRHDGSQLARHGQGQQIGHEYLRAEFGQGLRRLEGDHHAHEKCDQRHNGQRVDSSNFKDTQKFFPAQEARTQQAFHDTEGDLARKFNLLTQVAQP
jgi:hypothetical protein